MRSREKIDSRRDGDDVDTVDDDIGGSVNVDTDVDVNADVDVNVDSNNNESNDNCHLLFPGAVSIKKSKKSQKNLRTFKMSTSTSTPTKASNPRRRSRRLWRVSGDAFDVFVIVVTFLVASEQIVPAASLSCYVCGGATGRPCGEIRYNNILL